MTSVPEANLNINSRREFDSDKSSRVEECDERSDAGSVSERTRLLLEKEGAVNKTNVENETNRKPNLDYRFYMTMSIFLIIYKGSEEMASVTLKQFVYSWCLNESISSETMLTSNDTGDSNSTDDCGHRGSKTTELEAQKLASGWELYFNLLNAVLVFISVCTYGTLSDYYGRKFFLCIAPLGYALRCGIVAVVVYFDLHIAWVLLAYGLDGLGGSSYAVSMFTYVSMADLTDKTGARVMGITLMETLLGVGKFSTQFGNGYFIHRYGYFYPMLTAAAGSFVSFLCIWLIFKETNHSSKDLLKRGHRCPPCTTLISRYSSFYIKSDTFRDRLVFWLCLAVFVLFEITLQGSSDPLVLYQLGSPFCWSSEAIGWYGALAVLLSYVLGCLMLRPLQFCMSTNTIACFGIISAISQYVVIGLAPSSVWIFMAAVFGLIKSLPKPILRALASTRASQTDQGAIFASLQSSELICKMVSSPMSLSIYSASLGTLKGLVFFVLAGINGLALAIMMYLSHLLKRQTKVSASILIREPK